MILDGTISDKDQLQRQKLRLCREFNMSRVPANSETLAEADEEVMPELLPILQKKPVRTISGVAAVAVMTSPASCPHGRCTYCPGGVENDSPQSYTGREPAARRAVRNDFDPYLQTADRIQQLEKIGHPTDKIDLIVMGGTFTTRPREYQTNFVKRCFDAMNGEDGQTLGEAHSLNRRASRRCIGVTVETRPDCFMEDEIGFSMGLGATRVELGVQILDDEVLEGVNRGHGVQEIIESTRWAKDKGLKICYHVMPGLPGSSPERDMLSFQRMFSDSRFRPDMLKIYPTLVVEGTPLYDSWKEGSYRPYTTEEAVEVVASMKEMVPPYVRIQRIQRDIPAPLIEAGVDKGHLRQLARKEMERRGTRCVCIRCREVGFSEQSFEGEPRLTEETYRASGGEEHFISFQQGESIVGYARLRLNESGDRSAHLRELKVFGPMVPLGESGDDWQHRGFGKQLVGLCEEISSEAGYDVLKVTSGVGVRDYYSSLGYQLQGVYMQKRL